MKYDKEYLSFEEQADLLISRGLECEQEELIKRLESVNYYRLSGYLFPFKQENNDNYYPDTKLSIVWDRELGYKPIIPVKNKNWNKSFSIKNNRIFGILSIIN